jgi:hypothetical protein
MHGKSKHTDPLLVNPLPAIRPPTQLTLLYHQRGSMCQTHLCVDPPLRTIGYGDPKTDTERPILALCADIGIILP